MLFLFPFFGTFVKQQPLLQRNFQHAQPFLGGVQLIWTGSKYNTKENIGQRMGLLPEMNKKCIENRMGLLSSKRSVKLPDGADG